MILTYILLSSLAVMIVSLIGIVTVNQTLRGWTERNLQYLTTLALGVFLVVAYNLFKEVAHTNYALPALLIAILGGVVIAILLDYIIPAHHHHEPTDNTHSHSVAGAHRIILSDSIHNITDGFLIATTFLIDIRLGLLTTLGIVVHEVAQEISEFFVLRSAGYEVKRALQINFVTSGSIIIGAVVGYFVASSTENIIGLLLAVASGIIIYTILRDLIPHSWKNAQKTKTFGKHLASLVLGVAMVLVISIVNADTHVHSTHDDEHHHEHSDIHDHEDDHTHADDHHHDSESDTHSSQDTTTGAEHSDADHHHDHH